MKLIIRPGRPLFYVKKIDLTLQSRLKTEWMRAL
jgi:hypothetical protein